MVSLATLLIACGATAALTALLCWYIARQSINGIREEERRTAAAEQQQVRDTCARELREVQQALGAELEVMRERSRRPLKSLVESFLG